MAAAADLSRFKMGGSAGSGHVIIGGGPGTTDTASYGGLSRTGGGLSVTNHYHPSTGAGKVLVAAARTDLHSVSPATQAAGSGMSPHP